MPKRLVIELTEAMRQDLEYLVKASPKPYVRERASAILQIADGKCASEVAEGGLLQKRRINTVCEWVKRFLAEGIDGL